MFIYLTNIITDTNMSKNQTIKQTIEQVKAKIQGINHMEKQQGTNVWTVQSKNASAEETAIELKQFGFKIVAVNLKNSVIIAEKNQ
jgi:hypothetical protein